MLVVAHEKQLHDRIQLVWTDPWASDEDLLGVSPLAKVPVLVAEDGEPIVESACICDYLDGVGSGASLLPDERTARLAMLRKAGLGRGLMDVAFGTVIQRRYAPGPNAMLEIRWRTAAERTAASLERLLTVTTDPDLGDLTIAVALSYLDFRIREIDWRKIAPCLSAWYANVSARESMSATEPQ